MFKGRRVKQMKIPISFIIGIELCLYGLAVDSMSPDETAAVSLEASFVLKHKL